MKRSDVLKIIVSDLEQVKLYCDTNEDFTWYAEEILSALEQLGVAVPPFNKEKSFTMTEDGKILYEICEWETE